MFKKSKQTYIYPKIQRHSVRPSSPSSQLSSPKSSNYQHNSKYRSLSTMSRSNNNKIPSNHQELHENQPILSPLPPRTSWLRSQTVMVPSSTVVVSAPTPTDISSPSLSTPSNTRIVDNTISTPQAAPATISTDTSTITTERKKRSRITSSSSPSLSLSSSNPPNPSGPMPSLFPLQYALITQARLPGGPASNAPVDYVGSAMLGDKTQTPQIYRFQTLVALMLSSQTKDIVTAEAMKLLKETLPGGLTISSILNNNIDDIHECIKMVGFHNTKIKNIVKVANILHTDYNDDIPSDPIDMMKLPGIGPKMTNLCMAAAWGKHTGIAVDVHLHRIANMLHWVNTKTADQTMKELEKFVPVSEWNNINTMTVGYGQTVCPSQRPNCHICPLAYAKVCTSSALIRNRSNSNNNTKNRKKKNTTLKKNRVYEDDDDDSYSDDYSDDDDNNEENNIINNAKYIAYNVSKQLLNPYNNQNIDIEDTIATLKKTRKIPNIMTSSSVSSLQPPHNVMYNSAHDMNNNNNNNNSIDYDEDDGLNSTIIKRTKK